MVALVLRVVVMWLVFFATAATSSTTSLVNTEAAVGSNAATTTTTTTTTIAEADKAEATQIATAERARNLKSLEAQSLKAKAEQDRNGAMAEQEAKDAARPHATINANKQQCWELEDNLESCEVPSPDVNGPCKKVRRASTSFCVLSVTRGMLFSKISVLLALLP